ncbi:MAG: hypothetical protein ACI83H_001566 [Glaciecola sp.]|jgi:hypothetical protein
MKNRLGLKKFLIGIGIVFLLIMIAPVNENLYYIFLFIILVGFFGYRIFVRGKER